MLIVVRLSCYFTLFSSSLFMHIGLSSSPSYHHSTSYHKASVGPCFSFTPLSQLSLTGITEFPLPPFPPLTSPYHHHLSINQPMYQVEQTNRQTINHVILSIPNPQQKRDENETKYLQALPVSTLTVNFLMTKSDVDTNVANKQNKNSKKQKVKKKGETSPGEINSNSKIRYGICVTGMLHTRGC